MTAIPVSLLLAACGLLLLGRGPVHAPVRLLPPEPSLGDRPSTARRARRGMLLVTGGSGTAASPLPLAASWDLLAACLRSGMTVPAAVRAVAPDVPGPGRFALLRTAELVALGCDPADAWAPAMDCADTAALARTARRTARSGAAMADAIAALARELRDTASDTAEARAQRAGVIVTGPLGLCFLPAFLCLGVVPVVAGLAEGMVSSL